MNLIDYTKKYGLLTHKEKKFGEIDYLILGNLSYIDFAGIINNDKDKITLNEAGNEFFKSYTNQYYKNNIIGVKIGIDIFKSIYKLPRYKDLFLYNYTYIRSEDEQFAALSIDICKDLTYISFEGTDDLVIGWKEDAELAYKFPTSSQKDAIEYLNKNINIFSLKSYIVGGHSKGGNLALAGSMYASVLVRSKIKHVYNFDGPGLKKEQFESKKYKRISSKYTLVVPNYSLVGVMLMHPEDMLVVSSTHVGLMAHNCLFWEVDKDKFKKAKLSDFSKKIDELVLSWIVSYNEDERKIFVDDLFRIFERANIESFVDIKEKTLIRLINIIKETTGLSKESREMINTLIKFLRANIKILASDAIKHTILPKEH